MNPKTLLSAAALATALSSCAYTGDPNQGGLFGWSQGMADERLAEREARLAELDRENAYEQGRSDALESEAARKQRQLNQAQ